MAYAEQTPARLVWDEPSDMLTTALPFRVHLSAMGEDKEIISDYEGHLTISAVTAKVCLAEGFEGGRLGLWCASPPFGICCHIALHLATSSSSLPWPVPVVAGCPTSYLATTSMDLTTPFVLRDRTSRSSSRVETTRISA